MSRHEKLLYTSSIPLAWHRRLYRNSLLPKEKQQYGGTRHQWYVEQDRAFIKLGKWADMCEATAIEGDVLQ